MILLVSGAHTAMRKYADPRLGWLLTPSNGTSISTVLASGSYWAADNDCFVALDKARYVRMLRRIASAPDTKRLLFVTVPDVVADARATLLRFRLWYPVVRYFGLPAAFVAQDGQTVDAVPWHAIRALFIGGSTQFKLNAGALVQAAKERDKWVHVGRVSTLRRVELVGALGADSIDGTIFSRMPDKFIPWVLPHLGVRQHGMMEVLCS